MLDELLKAIAALSDGERNIIYALFNKGKTIRDVAHELGLSHVAVLKRKKKVIEKLKQMLKV